MTLPADLRSYRAPVPLLARAADFAWRCGIVLAATFAFAMLIAQIEAKASPKETKLILLENSAEPLTLAECDRVLGKQAQWTISFQNAIGHWHHRTCAWTA